MAAVLRHGTVVGSGAVAFALLEAGLLGTWDPSMVARVAVPVAVAAIVSSLFQVRALRAGSRRERRLLELSVELKEKEWKLEQQATTDPLTGLYNRRFFYEQLGNEFRRAGRYGRDLSVLLLDLDHFKRVNDQHGHGVGDFVLAEFADIVRSDLRDGDVCARYGGEEFVVMLPETSAADARLVADRIRGRVRDRLFATGDTALRMTVSQGVAAVPHQAIKTSDDLVSAADSALYEAKRSGRDRVVVFSEAAAEVRPA